MPVHPEPRARITPLPGHHSEPIINVTCPVCHSAEALIAATHYARQMCFCPACEHAWNCENGGA
jgi:hypothetical protein